MVLDDNSKKKRRWILLVEDDPDAREVLMEDLFDAFGNSIKFVEAKDGVEATHKLTFQAFDCIITDLQMPNRDGKQFIEFVKKSPLNASGSHFLKHPCRGLREVFGAGSLIPLNHRKAYDQKKQ